MRMPGYGVALMLAAGCQSPREPERPPTTSLSARSVQVASRESTLSQEYLADVDALLGTPTVELPETPADAELQPPEQLGNDLVPLMCDGISYRVMADHSRGVVWLSRSGGIGGLVNELSGPWPASNPHAVRLMAEFRRRAEPVRNNE